MQKKHLDTLLYAVTDRECIGERNFFDAVECALKGGATMLQLREKGMSETELVDLAIRVKIICKKYKVPLIINDNYVAALKAGADGVHLGQNDAQVWEVRALAGDEFIIGATAKTVEQALKAYDAGADYLGVGAVFASPTKKDAIRITREEFMDIAFNVGIPCVAIGGINRDNIMQLQNIGADGVALISSIFGEEDISEACREYKLLAEAIVDQRKTV